MFVVFLRFSDNRSDAPRLMAGHNAWIRRGFDEGVFLTVGSLEPKAGGAIVAHGATMDELQARVAEDPFVAENVVRTEIFEITPARTDERLAFLMG